jgi:uncharacterized membrane-anchored protein YhcB (DUF1043 family)
MVAHIVYYVGSFVVGLVVGVIGGYKVFKIRSDKQSVKNTFKTEAPVKKDEPKKDDSKDDIIDDE